MYSVAIWIVNQSRGCTAVPTVMASPAFMELQSAFGSGAPPNLNMDTTFTQRQRETRKRSLICQPTVLIGDRSQDLGTSRFSSDDRWQKEVIQPIRLETKYDPL